MTKKSNTKLNGSCLGTSFKGIGIFFLIGILFLFGWLVGIVWLLFFRKKLNNEPEKQRKQTFIFSAGSVISLIFFIYTAVSGSPTPESDANTSSSATIEETIDMVSEYASSETDVSESEPEPTPEAATEQERTPTESLVPEAIPEPTPVATSEPTELSTPEPANTPEPTIQPAVDPAPTESTQTPTNETSTMVWIDDSAAKYHKSSDSCGMDNAYQVTVEEAEAKGKTPCGRCY